MVLNRGMRARLVLSSIASCLLAACSQVQTPYISGMVDLPLKTTELPNERWQEAPLRANAQYVLYGANSNKERKLRIGDYYFLSWYDAEPEKPVKIVMQYTQAGSASELRSCTVEYAQPRRSSGYRKVNFQFVKAKTEGAAVELAQDTAMPLGVTPSKVRYSVPESLMHGTVRVPVNAHAADGDILSWRMDVYCGDETTPRDTRKSFLWD